MHDILVSILLFFIPTLSIEVLVFILVIDHNTLHLFIGHALSFGGSVTLPLKNGPSDLVFRQISCANWFLSLFLLSDVNLHWLWYPFGARAMFPAFIIIRLWWREVVVITVDYPAVQVFFFALSLSTVPRKFCCRVIEMPRSCVTVIAATLPTSSYHHFKWTIGLSGWTVAEKNRYTVGTLAGRSCSPMANLSVAPKSNIGVVLLIDDILVIIIVDMYLLGLPNLIFMMTSCSGILCWSFVLLIWSSALIISAVESSILMLV